MHADTNPTLAELDALLESLNRQGLVYGMRRSVEAVGGLLIAIIVGFWIRDYVRDTWSLSGLGLSIAAVLLIAVIPIITFVLIVRRQQREMDGLRAMTEYGKLVKKLRVVRQEVEQGRLSRQGATKAVSDMLTEHRDFIALAGIAIPMSFLPANFTSP